MKPFIVILVMPGVCFVPYEIYAADLEAATAAAQAMAEKMRNTVEGCYGYATPKQVG